MELTFEVIDTIDSGTNNCIMCFWDEQVQLFYIKNGEIYSKIAKITMGDWSNIEWVREKKLLDNVTGVVELQVLSIYHNLVVGVYRKSDNTVNMFYYEY